MWAQEEGRPGRKIYRLWLSGEPSYTRRGSTSRTSGGCGLCPSSACRWASSSTGCNGALFAILQNRPIWNSAMTPLLFIMAAILSGGALITFLALVFYRIEDELVDSLGRCCPRFPLVVFLFLEASRFLSVIAAASPPWYQPEYHRSRSLLVGLSGLSTCCLGSFIPLYLLIGAGSQPQSGGLGLFPHCHHLYCGASELYLIPDLAVYKLEGLQKHLFHHASAHRLRSQPQRVAGEHLGDFPGSAGLSCWGPAGCR